MAKVLSDVFKYDPRSGSRIRERPRLSLRIDPSENMTSQEFKEDCDINKIMAKFRVSGTVPMSGRTPIYGDFTDLPDFQEANNIVLKAKEAFASLSAAVRKHFDNDPGKYLAALNDPDRAQELLDLGLRKAPQPEPGPVRVEVVNQAPAEPPAPK